MLQVNSIAKTFDHHKAVDHISMHVPKGMFYGLLGPNGAGKTTTIHMISGIMQPDAGAISVDGMDVYSSAHAVKLRMGIVPQEIALYDELSALDNLLFWGNLYHVKGKSAKPRATFLLEWVGLSDRMHDAVGTYSGGMKRRVNIAAALMHDPALIIMDEPTVGIDPQSRNKIYELLTELHAQGKSILYTTHYMEEAERMCDRIGIIDKGRIIAEGTLSELKRDHEQDERVVIHYAGETKQSLVGYHVEVDMDAHTMVITLPHARKQLHDIIQQCNEHGIDITNIDVHQAGLESIFLHLTGRQLRD